jgi:hypothetical protein
MILVINPCPNWFAMAGFLVREVKKVAEGTNRGL